MFHDMQRVAKVVCVLGTALAVVSCGGSSTSFTDMWKDPSASQFQFRKILAMVITADDSLRRAAEDQLAQHLGAKGAESVVSYSFISGEEIKNVETAKAKVKQQGLDGAVIMRVVGVQNTSSNSPGRYVADPYAQNPYSPFWGYYSTAWPAVYESGYSDRHEVVRVETRIYSVPEEKMLWAGYSETVEPESVAGLIDEIAKAAAVELKKQKLIR